MYRILVVDDEKNERECILYLLRDSGLPLEIGEAEDGISALERLAEWPAHILFTDVQMPRMDGLALIRTALTSHPDLKPVIFSGYADFEYAKTAITLGVENYILKPVVPDELKNTMLSLIRQLDEEQAVSRQKDNQQTFLLQYALQLLISGNFEPDKADAFVLKQLHQFRFMVMLDFKTDFLGTHYSSFYDSLNSQLHLNSVSLNISPRQALLFLRTPVAAAESFCEHLLQHVRQQFHTDCYIAISRQFSDYTSMKDAFSSLEQQMEQRFWMPEKHIFLPGRTAVCESEEYPDDSQLLPMVKNALSARNGALLQKYLEHLFSKYRLPSNQSQIYVKFLFSNLLTMLYAELPEAAARTLPPLEEQISGLYLQPDISEIIKMIRNLSDPIIASFSAGSEHMRKEVLTVLSYINQNYDKELSVEILASVVYLTPDYLSRLFKKDIGKSIPQYIRQFRMEKARDALLNTRKKIIDIGVESGYPNYSYFCQSFREYFGSSPEKYRQENTL